MINQILVSAVVTAALAVLSASTWAVRYYRANGVSTNAEIIENIAEDTAA
jgi:hypothetical protein